MHRAAADGALAARLALANVTVLVCDSDDEQSGIWLRLGSPRMEIRTADAAPRADVCLRMPTDLLELFPFFHLAIAMADGRVIYEGDPAAVREVIALVPVLRTAVDR
jgi:hypothetical protein